MKEPSRRAARITDTTTSRRPYASTEGVISIGARPGRRPPADPRPHRTAVGASPPATCWSASCIDCEGARPGVKCSAPFRGVPAAMVLSCTLPCPWPASPGAAADPSARRILVTFCSDESAGPMPRPSPSPPDCSEPERLLGRSGRLEPGHYRWQTPYRLAPEDLVLAGPVPSVGALCGLHHLAHLRVDRERLVRGVEGRGSLLSR